jgi:DNA phosphorothioation system restriction enzyme
MEWCARMSKRETKRLRDLDLPAVIETSTTDFIQEFYNPVLRCAAEYKRGVGYFTSGWLQFAAQGMAGLARNNGTAKWITSPNLEEEDWEAVKKGEEAKRNEILHESLQRSVDEIEAGLEDETVNTLAWLIADGLLEIRFAMPDGTLPGDFHDKWGVIAGIYDDKLAFHGSKNDSKQGFYNYESYDIFSEWESDRDADRVRQHENRFDLLWNDRTPDMQVYNLPETLREDIVQLRESDNRPYPEPDMSKNEPTGLSEPDWIERRPYQEEAVQNWMKAGGQGILKMATGTGKTLASLLASHELYDRQGERLALIVAAPYQHLVEQWKDAMTDFNMDPILAYKSRSRWEDDFARTVTDFNWGANDHFSVITTHKTFSSDHFQNVLSRLEGDECLLILDEVHHMGASHYREQLPPNIQSRLGLSATPERYYDDTGTECLFNYFGNGVVFEYGIRKAVDNEFLCEYYYIPHVIELTEDEEHRYLNLSERIGQLSHVVDDDIELTEDDRLKVLLIKRARLIGSAVNKIKRLKKLMPQQDDIRHTLVYCGDGSVESDDVHEETQRHVDATVQTLGRNLGLKVHPFTAQETQSERERLLHEFEDGDLQALVAIRCLDEGVDVPATKTAYLLASSTNPIQFVQRRGRILRQYPGKERAVIHDFIVAPPKSVNPNTMDSSQFNMERKLISKELKRASVFAEDALNHPDAELQGFPTSTGSIRKLKEDFNLLGI